MFEENTTTFFAAKKPVLRLIACTGCGGEGEMLCRDCYRRRFSTDGRAMVERLADLLGNEVEPPEEGENE